MTATTPTTLPSLDDIVFEGRNKAYGAYVLRKLYGRHVQTALVLVTALAALLVAIPLVVQRLWPAVPIVPEVPVVQPPLKIIDVVLPDNKVAPPRTTRVTVRPPAATTPTHVVPNETVTKPEPVTKPTDIVDGPAVVGPVAQVGDGAIVTTGPVGTGHDTATETAPPVVTTPFIHVENMPEFVGGEKALMKYLQSQLRYPPVALRNQIEGKVFISFTVNADGTISDVAVLRGLGYGTDEEASRVISKMPAWKPGYQNKHAVPVRYTLPITFQFE